MAIGLASMLVASTAGAQLSGGQWRVSPNTGYGRRAVAVNPEPTVFQQPGMNQYYYYPSQPAAVFFVPAVLMSDGRIYANFGGGFEQVIRPCANYVVTQPTVVGSNGAVLYQPQKPTYMQPSPNQMTPSQRMVQGGQIQTGPAPVYGAPLACFSTDPAGRVFAYRY